LLLDQVFRFLDQTSYQKIEDPLPVKGDLVTTGLHVNINDFVITVAQGKVTFAPFTPAIRDADGEDNKTPKSYPVQHLRKNSLICRVGNNWYQGGVFRGFIIKNSGSLYLRANDQWTFDNLGEWKVMLFIINEIDSWFSKGFKSEIFALASGDGELKMTFNNLMLELSKEAENRTLRQNLYGFAADVVKNLLYS